MSLGASASFADALAMLKVVVAHPRHRFWPDALGYAQVPTRGIQGHRQVTDAYLAALHGAGVELVVADRDQYG